MITSSDPAIRVTRLTKTYQTGSSSIHPHAFSSGKPPRFTVLNDVNLEIQPGEIFALMGPNGAGKTTLMRILCGLILPDHGQVQIQGTDVARQPQKIKSALGFVTAEERGFYSRLTGRQNLEFFGSLYGYSLKDCRKKIEQAAQLLEISYLDEWYQKYSTGMKRWIGFARALMHEPSVLLIDEPTRSLDPEAAYRLRDLMKRRFDQLHPLTVFFTTHQIGEAEELADRIAILNQGELRTKGSLQDFIETATRGRI